MAVACLAVAAAWVASIEEAAVLLFVVTVVVPILLRAALARYRLQNNPHPSVHQVCHLVCVVTVVGSAVVVYWLSWLQLRFE